MEKNLFLFSLSPPLVDARLPSPLLHARVTGTDKMADKKVSAQAARSAQAD
jgi:hypothetical protein